MADQNALDFSFERIADEIDPSDTRLVLHDRNDPRLSPIAVDFLSGQMNHRRRHGLGKNQPLPRALGIKSLRSPKTTLEEAPYVVDATAGQGTDAFIMACLGCRVLAIERSEVVYRLLEDGYRRLRRYAEARANEEGDEALLSIADRLCFVNADSETLLSNWHKLHAYLPLDSATLGPEFTEIPDVVYLDPMYPDEGRSKSALPKKGMQVFRRLVGEDQDAHKVFEAAKALAGQRVVVKRPLYASAIQEKPTHTFEGKTARYDMYLINR